MVIAAYTLSALVTAYCRASSGPITALGRAPRVGIVAVDAGVIPLGSRVFVPGLGWRRAADTGVIGRHVDVFASSCPRAWAWGKRHLRVLIARAR